MSYRRPEDAAVSGEIVIICGILIIVILAIASYLK